MVNRDQLIKGFNLVFLSLLSIAIIYFIIYFLNYNAPTELKQCNALEVGSAFYYESCYDAYSKKIFFGVKRGFDDFKINSLDIKFFDFADKSFGATKIPAKGGSEIYKIPAEKNPGNINVVMDIESESIENVCPITKGIFVTYCSQRLSGSDVELDYNPLKNIVNTNYVDLGSEESSDTFSLSLVEKEKIWENQCSSSWECAPWEDCINNVQKRTCTDIKKCFIPTKVPEFTRYCDGACIEKWECIWSSCSNGVTAPNCNDINHCGTEFNRPSSLKCNTDECSPNITCSDWTACHVNYSFFDVNNPALDLGGIKSRICQDGNGCADPVKETSNCSLGVDIYTKTFKKCGSEFIGLYNKLDDSLIARIDQGEEGNYHTNIYFEEGEMSEYCDYCFDGILNGDETKIDCGGSCTSCYDKYGSY